jgi:alanyl-tRNA synthetase
MTAAKLRQKYLEFFKNKGHTVIPSASLIPENDPTVLFTTAGMHPLVPFLMGEKHPAGKRLTNVQKCIRTGDIDEVGDQWHLTFFEMLGNWSLGDPEKPDGIGAGYFKKEAIEWSFEFLTKELKIPLEKLSVSVFAGDKDAPFDQEAYDLWQKAGIPAERIYKFGKTDNWWGPAGATGPCGPCSEMFYDTGQAPCGPKCDPSCNCGKYAEIWNDVFLGYNKIAEGKFELLKQKNIDTGMGLERTIAVLSGKDNAYETELFQPIFNKIVELAGAGSNREEFIKSNLKPIRIIADHVRAATFILGDQIGVVPSNLKQGYVLRRLIRRAVRYAKMIGINIKKSVTPELAKVVVETLGEVYPEIKTNEKRIYNELEQEENKFGQTLEKGLKEFNKLKEITGKEAFILFSTYGFPLELTEELAREKGFQVNREEFQKEFQKHQELSRTASAGMFKGGLADAGEIAVKYHTATHLLHAALRQVLGDHVFQKGSNINSERLRFDFSHPDKMTPEQIKQVEDLVNKQIQEGSEVKIEELSVEQAKAAGAIGVFEHKYGDKVKVYSVGDFSKEICGGPHVANLKELGHFKILKEESSSAGVRRIKAVLE